MPGVVVLDKEMAQFYMKHMTTAVQRVEYVAGEWVKLWTAKINRNYIDPLSIFVNILIRLSDSKIRVNPLCLIYSKLRGSSTLRKKSKNKAKKNSNRGTDVDHIKNSHTPQYLPFSQKNLLLCTQILSYSLFFLPYLIFLQLVSSWYEKQCMTKCNLTWAHH